MPGEEAYVSLVTNDSYANGAIALGRSLQDTMTGRKLSLLITNEVSHPMRERLRGIWDELTVVDELDSEDTERLALLTRPELGVTFSKIHAWRLTQYTKCVFLDADTLVLENVDDLFDREELSAAPDIGWPDCFNSGVFVFEPSMETYANLLAMANQTGSFDGGDQGLLNLFWPDWATKDIKYHLPFTYNMVPNAAYGYAPAFQRFGRRAKIIHFIGPVKPWHHQYVPSVDAVVLSPGSYGSQISVYDFIKRWWQVFNSTHQLDIQAGAFSPPSPPSFSPPPSFPPPPSLPSPPSFPPPPSSTPYYHSCPPHHQLMTSFIKSAFVQPSFSPSPLRHYIHARAPPSTPVDYRSPSPVGSCPLEGSAGNDDTDNAVYSDSVHLVHSISPSPSPPPSPSPSPVNFQEGAQKAITGPDGEIYSYLPSGKSQEQFDIEQGKIDYTGKHRFEFIQEALDRHLERDGDD